MGDYPDLSQFAHPDYQMVVTTLLIGALVVGAVLTFMALGMGNPVPWLFLIGIAAVVYDAKRRERARFVVWKDEYSVGVRQLDDDHQTLLNLINQFQTASHYFTGQRFEREAFDALIDYTRTHFAREEALMEQNGYPELPAHRAEHQQMIDKVESLLGEYDQRGHAVLQETAAFLKDWLLDHINGTDQAYAPFLAEKGVS